ncbi:DUF4260 family protein [Flavihumibacter fluvii]|uniref:DUF4260 family protein n=1 Tax=Flavihumibacter fluvii TaxID=2838157 RepID=UPI001BDE9672|nr:DUF4260 family protein [Flavihumibacter fluvii]ULQ53951.1 DUF4260 domain-containing protein [Flavihumibacter fluvii]
MKKIIALEEVAQFITAAFCYYLLHLPLHWSLVVLVFFSPDIGAAGYFLNNITGTFLYNLLHHKLLALLMIGIGYFIGENWLVGLGLLYFAHSSFDRALGYGLKFPGNPGKTHLGYIGKEK